MFCLKKFALGLAGLLLVCAASGQTQKELEEKRKKIIRDIESTQRMIRKTAQNKEAAYDRYMALQNQIQSRESLIETYSESIDAAEEALVRNRFVIESLTADIARMEEEYGKMVRSAFRRKMTSNPLLFILSAENLNQAFRRWLFLRKYDQFRRMQAEAIRATREMLSKKSLFIEQNRIEKEQLLISVQAQKATLTNELTDKNEMLKALGKDESRLRSDLKKKEAAHEKLNQAIEGIIQEAVRKRVEESRKARPESPAEKVRVNEKKKNEAPEIAEADAESVDFRKNKGRLPWPVESGFVTRGFGRQKHPTLKNIEITNNGIDIRTEDDAPVRAVYSGKVAAVQFVPGHDYTVILQHGDFYTVYTNLSQTGLSKGDAVKIKQSIGTVSVNPVTGASELHFELWEQKERLNPALWIRK